MTELTMAQRLVRFARNPARLGNSIRWRVEALVRWWRNVNHRPTVLRTVSVADLDIGPAAPAASAAQVIERCNAGLVRAAIPADTAQRIRAFAETAVTDNGNNLVWYTSSRDADGTVRNDFALVRSILSERLVAIVEAYFERTAGTPDFMLPVNNLLIRRFSDATDSRMHVPFHQDGVGLRNQAVALNCWTMLSPDECGTRSSPGLELDPRVVDDFYRRERSPRTELYASLEPRRRSFGSVRPITPSIRLGDVLVFNGLCLHRTSLRKGFPSPRISAEIRVLPAVEGIREEERTTGAAFAHVSGGRIRWASRLALRDDRFIALEWSEAPLGPL
jgi:hypothetical protein